MVDANILKLAEQLADAMANAAQTRAFKQKQADAHADQAASGLLGEYEKAINELADKERGGKPIEPSDKHRLASLQQRISSNDKLKALMAAQVDYMDMVQQVNDVMGRHLVDEKK